MIRLWWVSILADAHIQWMNECCRNTQTIDTVREFTVQRVHEMWKNQNFSHIRGQSKVLIFFYISWKTFNRNFGLVQSWIFFASQIHRFSTSAINETHHSFFMSNDFGRISFKWIFDEFLRISAQKSFFFLANWTEMRTDEKKNSYLISSE